jgi:pyroglutamyl-peptidase
MRSHSKFGVQSSRSVTSRRRIDTRSASIVRTLIYGFGPYQQYKANITEDIVRALPQRNGLHRKVFPVRFHKKQFIEAVDKIRPDVILGLGQCSTGGLLRVETSARNRRRNPRFGTVRDIVPNGMPRLATTLKLKLGRRAKVSNDAGDYVCNYSMYVILDYVKRRNLPTLYGFVHVPHSHDAELVVRLVQWVLGNSTFKVQSSKER